MPITLNGSGTVSGISAGGLPDGCIQSADIASGVIPAGGKILQVKQTFKNDTASTSSGSFSDISGLTVSITPSATSSKILDKGSVYLGYTGAEGNFRLKRTIGGTATDIGVSSVLDDDADGSFAIGGSSLYVTANFEFLDSPNTTSQITYSVGFQLDGGTGYFNRNRQGDVGSRGTSVITAMEIAQ